MSVEDIHYLIAKGISESQHTDRGSKFIGYCVAVGSEDEAKDILAERRKLHYNATHNCWAYRIGSPSGVVERSSDDGEPPGSAGRPILDQIKKADIYGVIVVVTRWFGGTKLGSGGLVRAYRHSSELAIAEISTVELRPLMKFKLSCGYEHIGLIEKLTAQFEGTISDMVFTDRVELVVTVPAFHGEALERSLTDQGAGRIGIDEG
jgi:uncharacterized YigZ family protein